MANQPHPSKANTKALFEQLRNAFDAELAAELMNDLQPVIGVFEDSNCEIHRGSSKIFGEPDLPPDFEPPEEMDFLAQINFADITQCDTEKQQLCAGTRA
jgi:uncharacterized protein YwqG